MDANEPRYWYVVYASDPKKPKRKGQDQQYRDVADAMAAWSRAVSDGYEYAVLEALREVSPGRGETV